jgi:tetratricopeptide (TPR) repeat protein
VIQTFTIETEELTGVEAEIRDVNARAMELREIDPQAALDWLNQFEHVVEKVSVTRQGRFHNQRALALEALKEYDRAILEFDRAAYCFEQSGETELQGMIRNNIARTYSLSGNYTRAHESVDAAIRLATKPEYLIQWIDQKANVFIDEGKPEFGLTEIDKALALLVGGEQVGLLAECLATKSRIEKQINNRCATVHRMVNNPPDTLNPSNSTPALAPRRGNDVPSTPLECAQRIIRDNYDLALPLLMLMAMTTDPNGDPNLYSDASAAMDFLCMHTPQGEEFCQSLIGSLTMKTQELSDVSS